MTPVSLRVAARDGEARCSELVTPHGIVATPGFMPVGTRGSVRGVDATDLRGLGAEILLANTYHLMLRPGADTVAALGELQVFMGWHGPVLTDSGGYQVFSLEPRVTEDGVIFRSTYDGARVELTPERAVAVQETLGGDIAMVLDQLVGLPAPKAEVREAMERTLRWSARALQAKRRSDRALFGIVQGGVDPALRAESASRTADLGFPGFGIGGLSVGESRAELAVALEAAIPELPSEAPRYVMGLGDTEQLLDAVSRGVDLFDCVLPTRLARHGKVLHPDGDFSIKLRKWAVDPSPLQTGCDCPACGSYSRGYIRHLFQTKERLGGRLVSLHNLRYTLRLLEEARAHITARSFVAWRDAILDRRGSGSDRAFGVTSD